VVRVFYRLVHEAVRHNLARRAWIAPNHQKIVIEDYRKRLGVSIPN
jgi:hypothetical protein